MVMPTEHGRKNGKHRGCIMVHIVHDSFMFANLVQLQVREISFWVRFMVELVSGVYEPAHTWGFKQ